MGRSEYQRSTAGAFFSNVIDEEGRKARGNSDREIGKNDSLYTNLMETNNFFTTSVYMLSVLLLREGLTRTGVVSAWREDQAWAGKYAIAMSTYQSFGTYGRNVCGCIMLLCQLADKVYGVHDQAN